MIQPRFFKGLGFRLIVLSSLNLKSSKDGADASVWPDDSREQVVVLEKIESIMLTKRQSARLDASAAPLRHEFARKANLVTPFHLIFLP